MVERLKSRWTLAGVVVLVLLSAGGLLAPLAWSQRTASDNEAPTDSVATTSAVSDDPSINELTASTPATGNTGPGRQTVAAGRGPIAAVVSLSGRVAAQETTTLSSPRAGRVQMVAVKPGQSVEAGQLLLSIDATEITRQLQAAQDRLESSSLRLAHEQARLQARKQQVVADAEDGFRRAEADRARVMRGADPAEVRKAEQEVATARVALERAQADQGRMMRGADPAEVRKAEQEVATARVALERAQADQGRMIAGPNPGDVTAAERDLIRAQVERDEAQAKLSRLLEGPDPGALAAAERGVERAPSALQSGLSRGGNNTGARASGSAASAAPRAAAPDAQDQLTSLRAGATAGELDIARRSLQAAELGVTAARERLEAIRSGPVQAGVYAANAGVEAARVGLQNAEAHLAELQSGPRADPAASAVALSGVESARVGLQNAEAHLAELRSHPTPDEQRAASDQVAVALAAVQRARRAVETAGDDSDLQMFDFLLTERAVHQDREQVALLQRDLDATRLVAPYAGVVSSVLVSLGQQLEMGRSAVVLANRGDPIVQADVSEREAAQLAMDQRVTVQLDTADSPRLRASFVGFGQTENDAERVALFTVAWEATRPSFGAAAQIEIIAQEKADALLLPQRAVRSSGSRHYVEYMEGTNRRTRDVDVGISAGDTVEILSGVSEGQLVLVRP